jgi:membrane fusion protein (multidrug efflux system)
LAIAALLVPRLYPSGDSGKSSVEAAPEVLEVETLVVTPHRLVERFATVGTILANEQVQIRSEIAGIIEEILFEEGSRVVPKELLVQIVDTEFVAERDRAQFQVELARLREERQKDLFTQGLTSQDEYDLALSRLNVLQAELRLAEAQLAKTEIRAPFAGIIGLRRVSRGAALAPQMAIATLQEIDTVKMEFTVPESYAGRLRLGESVRFRVKGSTRDHEGEVYAFEPNVDRETRSLRARARSANPDGELLPGAFADVELVIREIEDALTVPAIAIIPELGTKKVFVVEDGRAVPRLVETGVRTDTEVQVIRGLAASDKVIVSAIQRLSSGLPVREKAGS